MVAMAAYYKYLDRQFCRYDEVPYARVRGLRSGLISIKQMKVSVIVIGDEILLGQVTDFKIQVTLPAI